jgi:cyclophilin family peptidyl-prolyl cis-trans isomerase
LLAASLQSIPNMNVPAQQGSVVALLAQSTTTDPQTFSVTSSNPDIGATINQGPFWTVGVSYTDPNTSSNSFTGALTFQLFQTLTPNTVKMITQFTNDNYYVTTGKYFPRIVKNFRGTGNIVVQGGSSTPDNSGGGSGQPGTPFPNENVQQLTLTGTNQLSLANSDTPTNMSRDSNDTQFFINTGQVSDLGYDFTIFGQMVSGQPTLTKMTKVPLQTTSPGTQPVNPIIITSTTFSSSNPNGVLIIDASQATKGETSTITVTATDPTDGSTSTQSFTVTISAYAGKTNPPINFRPFANPTTASVLENASQKVQLDGTSGYPGTPAATLTYQQLTQPSHGTVTNFDSLTGTFTYTPNHFYMGPDTFQYQVTSTGPKATPATLTSNPGTVTLNVGPGNTQAVQLIGSALVITPTPRRDHGTNKIQVSQVTQASGGSVIQVTVNGEIDQIQPAIDTIDRIIVFGGNKAKNDIIIGPSVQVATTIDGGHGLVSFLTGGGAPTREHGWFGHTTLIGGPGINQLIGLAGRVRFKPSKTSNIIYAGVPHRRTPGLHPVPPSGTFYRFVHNRLVPIKTV